MTGLEAVKKAITPGTRLVHIETPDNPTVGITDIEAIAKLAHENGAVLLLIMGIFMIQNSLVLTGFTVSPEGMDTDGAVVSSIERDVQNVTTTLHANGYVSLRRRKRGHTPIPAGWEC